MMMLLAACEGDSVKLPEPLGLCDGCDLACDEEAVLAPTRVHVDGGVDYTDVPPTSGDHDPCWAPWGVHATEVPDENWVHNLEHGGIVLLYRCPEGCPDEVAELERIVAERGTFGLLTPYEALPTRFASVSWGFRYVTDCFDAGAIEAFWDEHVDHAPESITADPGTGCGM